MKEEGVQQVTRFIAAGQGEHLIGGQVDRVQLESEHCAPDDGHEAPGRVLGPFDLRGSTVSSHDRADVSRLADLDVDAIAVRAQRGRVRLECRRDPRRTVVEIAEIVAESKRIRGGQDGRAAGEIAVFGAIGRQQSPQPHLEGRQRQSPAPFIHASRPPCRINCSATQATSSTPIRRPGGLDQKQLAWKRRNARRASRTRTMALACSGSRRRRLLRPPRRPISAR
jgi:hypothetical protein